MIKLFLASIRWGRLSESESLLIKKSSLKSILRANYIKKTSLSQKNTITLD